MKTKLANQVKKLLRRKKKPSTATKVLVGAGATLAVAGAVGAALKVAADRKKRAAARVAREDADARARMEAEGGALQPVTPAPRAKAKKKRG